MRDFWLSSGHHLLDRDKHGRLCVTDEFIKLYLARPELVPPAEACVVERVLHAALLSDPWRPVAAADIDAIADADARENWHHVIALRDHLGSHPTLEAAYVALMRGNVSLPSIFVDQLVQLILRNLLDGCDDACVLRAAELFFRPQRLSVHDGSLVAADREYVDAAVPGSPLVVMFGVPESAIEILSDANARDYWQRSDRFDLAIDLTAGRGGLAALGAVIVRWVKHLLDIDTDVEPLTALNEVAFTWYVGLDAHGTRIGDALWHGAEIDGATRERVVGLFRLTIKTQDVAIDRLAGKPVYLIMAMAPDRVLRMKPQNLVTGLPIRHGKDMT